MVGWFGILLRILRSAVRTRRELALEYLALRQQLAVWKAHQPRPRLTEMDQIFWVLLSRLGTSWRDALQLIRPETVVGWHRQGFRRYRAWKSRRRSGRPVISTEVRDLRDAPEARTVQPPSRGRVVKVPRVGGLH